VLLGSVETVFSGDVVLLGSVETVQWRRGAFGKCADSVQW
jgi:hypothetical protein